MALKHKYFCLLLYLLLFYFNSNFAYCLDNKLEGVFQSAQLAEPIKLEARIDTLEIDLEKALNIAILQNFEVKEAQLQKSLQRWRLFENFSNWLPDYKTGLSAQRLDGNFLIGGVFPVKTLNSNVNAFMRFDYKFFEGGKGLFNTLASKNLYKSSKENLSVSINNILLAVTKAYNNLLKEQIKIEVLSKGIEEAKLNLELNKNLEKQGVGTKFDILQSEVQLAEQERAFIEGQGKLREASIRLSLLLNLEQGTHILPDKNDLIVKKLFDLDKSIIEIIDIAKSNRPEVKRAQLEYAAQKNYIGTACSGFLPKANFFGQYGGTGNVFFHRSKVREVVPDAIALDENGNPIVQKINRDRFLAQNVEPQNVSNVIKAAGKPFPNVVDDSLMANRFLGIEVGWDIGDGIGFTTISKINQARYQSKLAKLNLNNWYQKIEEEVRLAYLDVQTAEKLIDVAKKKVNASQEALHLAKVRLENGVGINTELLNAQRQHLEALADEVNALIEYGNSQAELLHNIGLISVEKLIRKS